MKLRLPSRDSLRTLALSGATVVVWALLNRAAAWFEVQPGLTFFFPAAAVTVAAAARLRWPGVIAIAVAHFVLPWGEATGLGRQAIFAVPATLWAGLIALLPRRGGSTAGRMGRFLGLGVAGGSLLAALSGGILLTAIVGWSSWTELGRTVALWWISDVTPALAFGVPVIVLLAPGVLLDPRDLAAAREWASQSARVWRTVALGVAGASVLLAASTLLGAEVHWFVVALLPAVVVASLGGGVAAGLVAAAVMSSIYLAFVLAIGPVAEGGLVVVLSSTYANLCLFVAFAIIAGVLSDRNRQLVEHVRKQGEVLTRGLEQTVEVLAATVHAGAGHGGGHVERVARLAVLVARELGMSGADLTTLRRAAFLHDVARVGVPEALLAREGELSPEELAALRQHVDSGYESLERVEFLRPVVAVLRRCHERWDGLREVSDPGHASPALDAPPLASRIIAAVEAFDILSRRTPGDEGVGRITAVAGLWRGSGSRFDPAVVGVLTRLVGVNGDLEAQAGAS